MKYRWTTDETYEDLLRPDGTTVTTITEPEDRIGSRDLAPVAKELNDQQSRIAALEAEVGRLREAMPELTKRRCRDCGSIAYHSEPITPYVLCRKCGSQDTGKTLLDFPQDHRELTNATN